MTTMTTLYQDFDPHFIEWMKQYGILYMMTHRLDMVQELQAAYQDMARGNAVVVITEGNTDEMLEEFREQTDIAQLEQQLIQTINKRMEEEL